MMAEPFHGQEIVLRVKGEFLEMPGLRVTEAQARRLWGLDAASCGALLQELVHANFLFRTRDGAFMRVEHTAPMKAALRPPAPSSVALPRASSSGLP
jgi:hypothetical protein